jgi:hypothetical protein
MPPLEMLSRLVTVAAGAGMVAAGMMLALPAAYPSHVPVGWAFAGRGVFGMGLQAWEVVRRWRERRKDADRGEGP